MCAIFYLNFHFFFFLLALTIKYNLKLEDRIFIISSIYGQQVENLLLSALNY